MKTVTRMFFAAALSPLIIVPTVLVAFLALNFADLIRVVFLLSDATVFFGRLLETTMFMSAFGVMFAWVGTFAVGIPVYVILRYFTLAQIIPCALVGAVFGALFGSFFAQDADFFFMTLVSGAAVAASFCRLAPD